MVNALCRAAEWVGPTGRVIDLRPVSVVATLEVGMPDGSTRSVGELAVAEPRRARYRAADKALSDVLEWGTLRRERDASFDFFYYADSANELRDYIATSWHDTRVDEATHRRAHEMLMSHPGARLWLREAIAIRWLTAPSTARYTR